MKCLTFLLLIAAVIVGTSLTQTKSEAAGPADNKMSAEEIISKHLESIGTAPARAAAGSRVVGGTTQVTFRSRGVSQTDGGAVLASDGSKSMITMKFDSSQYPYEKIGFDGDKVTAYQIHPGDYSSLGSFARAAPAMFKEGLLGGSLSSAWPFLDANRKFKLEVGGTKKINERPAYEVKYIVKGGSDLRISLFFDAETFQHVRTVYKKELPAQMSQGGLGGTQRSLGGATATGAGRGTGADRTGEASAQQSNTTYELTEEFSDFRTEGGLTLPHTYKIHLVQLGSATQMSDWVMTLVRFSFKQPLEAKDFDVSSE